MRKGEEKSKRKKGYEKKDSYPNEIHPPSASSVD